MSADHIETTVRRLRPKWSQLMANLVLRGWIITAVEGRAGDWVGGAASWTARLECQTIAQMEMAFAHKEIYGLRMYAAPTLQELLEQMEPVLAEFQRLELAGLPEAADAPTYGDRNRERKELTNR